MRKFELISSMQKQQIRMTSFAVKPVSKAIKNATIHKCRKIFAVKIREGIGLVLSC